MKYLKIPLSIFLLAYPVVFSGTAAETATPANQASTQYTSDSPEFKAAEDSAQRYMAAYNKGDAKTLADFYAEDVDYIDQDGAEVKGRDGIQKLLAENFRSNPGVKLDLTVEELKQLTPDVASIEAPLQLRRKTELPWPRDTSRSTWKQEWWPISQLPKRRRRHLTPILSSRPLSG